MKAVKAYQQLSNSQNHLGDATCISRTGTALADLLRRVGWTHEAARLEAQGTDAGTTGKPPNAQFLLRQSSQVALAQLSSPRPRIRTA